MAEPHGAFVTIDHKHPDPVLPTPDDMWGYKDKRVVVTGAASGMGLAAAKILVALGADVTGVDVQPIGYDGVAGKVTTKGHRVRLVTVGLRGPQSIEGHDVKVVSSCDR